MGESIKNTTREYRSLFLLVSVVLMVALSSLWGVLRGGERILVAFGFVLAIGIGGSLMAKSRRWLLTFWSLVLVSGVLAIVEYVVGKSDALTLPVRAANEVVSGLIYGVTIFVVLRFALFAERVRPLDRVLGGITGYFLIGLAWIHIYGAILVFNPAAISGTVEGAVIAGNELLYYSYITLTTQGYGEIVPVSPTARTAAAMEGVVGTLYVAILVASLVSELRRSGPPDPGR